MRSLQAPLLLLLLFLLPVTASAGGIVITTPQGITEVRLLSPGTSAVLDFLRERLDAGLSASSEKNQVDRLEKEATRAAGLIAETDRAYSEKVEALRKQYIEKLEITIHSASNRITPASALADITFFFTARNASERIISDITYKPVIGGIVLPITTSLVLEFINPRNLIFGLAPGETLTNQGNEPEHFSFFLNELKEQDIKRIQSSSAGGFSIEITDIRFVSQKGYKGQSRVMDVKEAFAGLLGPYQAAVRKVREDSRATSGELSRARAIHEEETREAIKEFRTKASDLRKISVRYQVPVDSKKNRASLRPVEPGTYIIYAPSGSGMAVFQEVAIDEGTTKVTITSLKKDPFEP